jgi:hypothetical protein
MKQLILLVFKLIKPESFYARSKSDYWVSIMANTLRGAPVLAVVQRTIIPLVLSALIVKVNTLSAKTLEVFITIVFRSHYYRF